MKLREQEKEWNNFSQSENDELLQDIFRLECQLFMKMDSYRFIEQKQNKKCLNSNEMQQLNTDIYRVFTRLIKTIKGACPKLTKEDIIFCCLVKSGLDNSIVSCCIGIVNKQAFNQRKYRIKKKMNKINRNDLFELIFPNK